MLWCHSRSGDVMCASTCTSQPASKRQHETPRAAIYLVGERALCTRHLTPLGHHVCQAGRVAARNTRAAPPRPHKQLQLAAQNTPPTPQLFTLLCPTQTYVHTPAVLVLTWCPSASALLCQTGPARSRRPHRAPARTHCQQTRPAGNTHAHAVQDTDGAQLQSRPFTTYCVTL